LAPSIVILARDIRQLALLFQHIGAGQFRTWIGPMRVLPRDRQVAVIAALTEGNCRVSKRLDNHAAAVSLYVAHYNLCRVHQTLGRITPAMALGITDHVWPIAELIEAAEAAASEAAPETPPQPKRPQFRVIQGGRA